MTTTGTPPRTLADEVAAVFAVNTADHAMSVLHDDGLYRHLRFARPGTILYRFDLVTWPGHLALTGDVHGFTFARQPDMLEFFAGARINPGYWQEKLVGEYANVTGVDEHALLEVVRREVEEYVAAFHPDPDDPARSVMRDDLLEDLEAMGVTTASTLQEFYDAADSYRHRGFEFTDLPDLTGSVTGHTFGYLYACHAIQYGANEYRRARREGQGT